MTISTIYCIITKYCIHIEIKSNECNGGWSITLKNNLCVFPHFRYPLKRSNQAIRSFTLIAITSEKFLSMRPPNKYLLNLLKIVEWQEGDVTRICDVIKSSSFCEFASIKQQEFILAFWMWCLDHSLTHK